LSPARLILFGLKRPPCHWANTQHLEEIPTYAFGRNLIGLATAGQIERLSLIRRDPRKRLVVVA
jgi:hypothetical protein